MKIRRLCLHNFRGIQDMTLEFSPGVTALVGMNGAGKSAVLDALAGMLMKQQLDFLFPRTFPSGLNQAWWDSFNLGPGDIRYGATQASLSASFYPPADGSNDRIEIGAGFAFRPPETMGLLNYPIHRSSVPAALYYDVQRAVEKIDLATHSAKSTRLLDSFWQVLSHGQANFTAFFNWFRDREDDENEKIRDQPGYCDAGLQAVRDAITAFTGFHSFRVRRKPQPHLTLIKQDTELNVMQLSDGERSLLALVGDLAHRLATWREVFPANVAHADAEPFNDEAIVLIDEIELHLHPGWQRDVLHKLRTVFPNCQFIVTTHSPQVVGELKPEEICLLNAGRFMGHPEYSYGLDSASALEFFMDAEARNPDVRHKLDAIAHALEDDQLEQAKHLIDALRTETGDIPDLLQHQSALESLHGCAGVE
jgi:predicted ATP-binding protein involved in virulence